MRSDFYVYVLFRHTGEPLYIGKGSNDRIDYHLKRRGKQNQGVRNALDFAETCGTSLPYIKIAENLTEAYAFELEKIFISAIGREAFGGPLVNRTDGGEGESGKIYSAEIIEKFSKAKRGKTLTEQHKIAISKACKGRKLTPEHIERLSAAHRGKKKKPWTEEFRARYESLKNPGHTGHIHTEEARKKISQRLKGKPWSAARRAAYEDKRHSPQVNI